MGDLSRADRAIAIRWLARVERVPKVAKLEQERERFRWVISLPLVSAGSFFFIPAGSEPNWFIAMLVVFFLTLGGVSIWRENLKCQLQKKAKEFGTAPAFFNTLPKEDAAVLVIVAKGRVMSLELLDDFLANCSEALRCWPGWLVVHNNPDLLTGRLTH